MLLFIFKSVLVCSLAGTLLFLLFTALRPLSQKFFTSSWHYFIGLMIVLIMLCPIRSGVFERAAEKVNSITYEEKNDKIETAFYENNYEEASAEGEKEFLGEKAIEYLSYAWFLCTCALLLRQSLSYRIYINKLNRSTQEIHDISVPLGTDIKVRMGKNISSPMVSGIISKTLYLPQKSFSESELNAILSHEAIHLQRRDLIAKRLIMLAKCVHFFNPAIYLLAKRIELDCEISCDLAATKTMSNEERQSYMLTILNLIPEEEIKFSPLSVGIVSGKEALKRRFLKIISREKTSKKTKVISALLATVAIGSSLCISGVMASEIKKPETISPKEATTVLPSENTEITTEGFSSKLLANSVSDNTELLVPTTVEYSCENFFSPCDSEEIVSEFGNRKTEIGVGSFHNGVDFKVKIGSAVYAAISGKVEFSGWDKTNNYEDGNTIVIIAEDGTEIIYNHLDSTVVNKGDTVTAGQVIAKSGATGNATGPCLHFSVVRNGKYVDPMNYLG